MQKLQSALRRLPISYNAPVTLTFVLLCVGVYVLNLLAGGASNHLLFSVYRSSALNPLTYLRLILHVMGHAGWEHLLGNMMYLLILGPMLEEKYGGRNLLLVMGATALSTGLVNVIFFPYTSLLGASGIVFAMILLSSFTVTEKDKLPLSFLLVAVLYIGQQVVDGLFTQDNISQMAHIVGGIVGSVLGFTLNNVQLHSMRR